MCYFLFHVVDMTCKSVAIVFFIVEKNKGAVKKGHCCGDIVPSQLPQRAITLTLLVKVYSPTSARVCRIKANQHVTHVQRNVFLLPLQQQKGFRVDTVTQ